MAASGEEGLLLLLRSIDKTTMADVEREREDFWRSENGVGWSEVRSYDKSFGFGRER